jgi:hypothetical protein
MKSYKLITSLSIILICLWSCKSTGQVITNPVIDSLEQEILGMWVRENDSSNKIKFKANGIVEYYAGNTLRFSENYEITITCDGEQQGMGSGIYFLKSYSSPNDFFCSYIENINYNGNNRMVLMTQDQGKIIVYVRP